MGRVSRAHGLRGEVLVELVTDRVERLAPGAVLQTDSGALEVLASRPHQAKFIVSFAGVDDREGADALRGRALRAESIDEPDVLWVHELIGSLVHDAAGAALGTVVAVEANPASDILVLDGGGLVPLRFVVAHEPGRVVVDPPPGLLD